MKTNLLQVLTATFLATVTATGCIADSTSDTESEAESDADSEDVGTAEDALSAHPFLDRLSGTKLRVATWNTLLGSVFPKDQNDQVWSMVNTVGGQYDSKRTGYAQNIFNAVDADVWLLQEVAYSGTKPTDAQVAAINSKLQTHMKGLTGDTWTVKCQGQGLCLMVRGSVTIGATCMKSNRANGYLLNVPAVSGSKKHGVVVGNVHFTTDGHADTMYNIMQGSVAKAKIVAGDFNSVQGDPRYNKIDSLSTLNRVNMVHEKDPGAVHLTAAAKSKTFVHTQGDMDYKNSGTLSQLDAGGGGTIDHFFFGSSQSGFAVKKSLIINTLLLSSATLLKYSLNPLAITISPSDYYEEFKSFTATNQIKNLGAKWENVQHDHLPFIVDLALPDTAADITPTLACP
jgi:hypothetical protein